MKCLSKATHGIYPSRHTFLLIILALMATITSRSSGHTAPKRPLISPPVPFVKTKISGQSRTFIPRVVGNSIVSGSKTLKIHENGNMNLLLGERDSVQIVINLKTDAGWWGPGRKLNKEWLRYDAKNQTFHIERSIPLVKDKGAAKGILKLTAQLTSKGVIQVEVDLKVPKGMKNSFEKGGIYFVWPDEHLEQKILVGSKEHIVSKDGNNWWFLKLDKSDLLTFFPGKPAQSFVLQPKDFASLIASTNKQMRVAIAFNKGMNRLSLNIDIRKGIEQMASEHSYAGIDFMAIEALEMPDYKSSKNLMPNPSFEQGLRDLRYQPRGKGVLYSGTDRWKPMYTIDENVARFGKSSLKVRTLYPSYNPKIKKHPPYAVMTPIPLGPGTYTFSCYMKGDRPGKQKLRIGDENFSPTGNWQRFTSTFTVKESIPWVNHIKGGTETGDGHIWVDGMQLEKGEKATAFETRVVEGRFLTSATDNFIRQGDKIEARLKIMSKSGSAGKVVVSAKDFFSETLFSDEFSFRCDKSGEAIVVLPFEGKFPRGIFMVKAEYTLDNGTKTHDFFRFSIMDFLENKFRLKNIFNNSYTDLSGLPNFRQRLERWKRIGIGARTFIKHWDKEVFETYTEYGVEPMCVAMLERVRKQQPNGTTINYFKVKGIGDRPPIEDYRSKERDAPLTEKYLKRFEDVVAETARQAPWVKIWKVTAEAGKGNRFGMNFPDYVRLLVAFHKGIRKGNPKAKIVQGGPTNLRLSGGIKEVDDLLTMIGNKVRFDIIGIHPYQESPENPDLDANTRAMLEMLKKHGYDHVPLLWPEGMNYGPYTIPKWGIESPRWTPPQSWYWGPLSYDMGWNEKISAAKRARHWLVSLKYQDRVLSNCSGAANNFDMDMYLTPFASQKIPNTLARLLGNARFKKDIRFARYTRCYIFEDDKKRPVAVVWGYHEKLDEGTMPPFQAKAHFKNERPAIFDLMEAERSVQPDANGNIQFPVSSFPLFFRGKSGSLVSFVKAFDNATLMSASDSAPVSVTGRPVNPKIMDVVVNNALSRVFNGMVSVNHIQTKVEIKSMGKANVKVSLPSLLQADRISREKLDVKVTETKTGNDFNIKLDFEGFLCLKTETPITADGKLDDWKNIPAIKLKNRTIHRKSKEVKDADFSGWFKVAWDEKGMYLCVNVIDDTFVHRENVKMYGDNPWHNRWNNDTLQIYFDAFCDAREQETRGYDRNDYDYALFPNAAGNKAMMYRSRSPDPQLTVGAGAPPDGAPAKNIPAAFRKTKKGYIYEVTFPSVSLLPINLEKGSIIGFSLFANDRDDHVVGKKRGDPSGLKSSLTLTPPGTGCYNQPHLWPVILLWE